MISLADFEPLSVAKINIFFINNRGFTERYFSDKVPKNPWRNNLHHLGLEQIPY